ncbi:MAG: ankyrin repeat domain-containing protein [Bacteroidetes bacterium]|nr:ankyrin repeat domain-containing protein [Bacteroidota bacterium]
MDISEVTSLIMAGKTKEAVNAIRENPSLAKERTKDGISLLQFAVYCRNKEVVDTVLPLHSAINFYEACSLGMKDKVRRELEKNPALLNSHAPDGFTALGLACFFNHPDLAAWLLEKGADPKLPSSNSFHVAPIHSACSVGSIDIVAMLIRHGADVNAKQQQDYTPLHQAAHAGRVDMCELLLKNGADRNAKTSAGQTPMDMAREKGSKETASLLER